MQEEKLIPPIIKEALDRARAYAHKMPLKQLEGVMHSEMGDNWRENFEIFENDPFAAASIG